MSHIQGVFYVELSGPEAALSVSVTCDHVWSHAGAASFCITIYYKTTSIIEFSLFSSHSNGLAAFVPTSEVRKSFLLLFLREK